MDDKNLTEGECFETISHCLDQLTKLKNSSRYEILCEIKARFVTRSVCQEDLENKNYTYVQAFCYWKNSNEFKQFRFLVLGRQKKTSRLRAERYLQGQGVTPDTTKKIVYHFKPGNYIRESRILFQEGKYL